MNVSVTDYSSLSSSGEDEGEAVKIRGLRKAKFQVETQALKEIMRVHSDEVLAMGDTLARNSAMSMAAATSARTPRERAGEMIGRYKLLEQIGEGGFGVVYRAEQAKLGREVALKVLKKADETDQEQQIDAFIEEARAAAKLSDPHLVQVYDVGESDGELVGDPVG